MELKADNEDAPNQPKLVPGTVLRGKYRIDRTLGTGGMATVYAVTHRNRKRFAIKVLHAEFSSKGSVRSRFVREGYVANTVEHQGVVAVLDDDVAEDGSPFLVMELLKGATVQELLHRGPLESAPALLIVEQLLDVLDAAHAKGVVHRDIKPANLFVTGEGQLKVLDFGIARLRDASPGIHSTRTGASLGTPAFMAPEQALALPDEIDARTDIWAVGATLFRMLTGRLVHEGDNARQLLVMAATEPPPALESVAPTLFEPVRELVDKALAFDKRDRWISAAAMRDAARRLFEDSFGDFDRAALGELAQAAHVATTAEAPTEPSPDSPEAPQQLEKSTIREPRAAAAAAAHPEDTSSIVSDIGKPVTGSGVVRDSRRRWRTLMLVAGFAGIGGVLIAWALGQAMATSQPSPSESPAPSPPAATPATPVRDQTARTTEGPVPLPETLPAQAPTAQKPSTKPARAKRESMPRAQGAHKRLAPTPAPREADPHGTPVAPAEPKEPDPLRIELQ